MAKTEDFVVLNDAEDGSVGLPGLKITQCFAIVNAKLVNEKSACCRNPLYLSTWNYKNLCRYQIMSLFM